MERLRCVVQIARSRLQPATCNEATQRNDCVFTIKIPESAPNGLTSDNAPFHNTPATLVNFESRNRLGIDYMPLQYGATKLLQLSF
jgi:hypothetical protein